MRERKDFKEYDIQIAANIVAGTRWVWTGENPHLISDELNPDDAIWEVQNLMKESRKKWKDFTSNMNA